MLSGKIDKSGLDVYRSKLNLLLGIPVTATQVQIHELIVRGFPATSVTDLCKKSAFSNIEWDRIIRPCTLQKRVSRGQPLTVVESDRLFRFVHILAMAWTIFGDKNKAARWLAKPKRRFNGRSPVSMVCTLPGMMMVEKMLLQIAVGSGW